jgi:hypothetical protein
MYRTNFMQGDGNQRQFTSKYYNLSDFRYLKKVQWDFRDNFLGIQPLVSDGNELALPLAMENKMPKAHKHAKIANATFIAMRN